MGQWGYARSMFLECAADGVFTSLPIKFIIKTIQWYRYEKSTISIKQTNIFLLKD